ncbi:DUF2273 domain-containing protein [Tissierella pigra]|uniref:DUF2273 domain-containing protein n=1 Tax=Tissierella pigra TaxID=2607614 RepID=A0A6N7XCZ4_9FIRM|nr:DUF2273 domain-containing protein [Tissierella pigra]MBU5426661.1 DUF2273 domain-containing protein [Tissierella pigra]MST99898.1 DUF2273 domain-containing protein [Tissierella pigra]
MIKQILRELLEIINNNRGKFFGALAGFLVAVSILIIGFFKTLFIFLCTCIGYILGSKSYKKIDFREILEKILPLGGRS